MTEHTHIRRVIEPQTHIQAIDPLHLLIAQPPAAVAHTQVLLLQAHVVRLRDDSEPALDGPLEQDLGLRLVMVVRDLRDHGLHEERGRMDGLRHPEFEEALRAEGAVGGHGEALRLSVCYGAQLGVVGVYLCGVR